MTGQSVKKGTGMGVIVCALSATFLVSLLGSPLGFQKPHSFDMSHQLTNQDVLEKFSAVDGYFIENAGQVTDGVRFYSRGNPSVGFRDDGVVFVLAEVKDGEGEDIGDWREMTPSANPPASDGLTITSLAYFLRFKDANLVSPQGRGQLPFESNFFLGNDSSRWKTGVPSYSEVVYDKLYDGIDLVYRLTSSGVKYELLIHPGANPNTAEMVYEGVQAIAVDRSGNLVVKTKLGDVLDTAPIAFQGEEHVSCAFALRTTASLGFRCDGWDSSRLLVIDPLTYSTYLGGGSIERPGLQSIAVDSDHSAYVTGWTLSADFPTSPFAYGTTYKGAGDIFVTKLSTTGTSLVYSTYIGGSGNDSALGIAVSPSDEVFVVGVTGSSDYPTTPGALDSSFNGLTDCFVTKLDGLGSSLAYSTFTGGSGYDEARAIDIYIGGTPGYTGSAYIAGVTTSSDFPVTPGAYDTVYNGNQDAVLLILDEGGTALSMSTFLGGSNLDVANALDATSNAMFVTGSTRSSDFPVEVFAFDTTYNGGEDVFVTELNYLSNDLTLSTFLGGGDNEAGLTIHHESGEPWIGGYTTSADFPTSSFTVDDTYNGGLDGFIAKLSAGGVMLWYSSFIGGSNDDEVSSLDLKPGLEGFVFATGWTSSADFHIVSNGWDYSHNGKIDAFVLELVKVWGDFGCSTFLGGNEDDMGHAIIMDDLQNAYVVGETTSPDFPVSGGAYDVNLNGASDLFVTKLNSECGYPPSQSITYPNITSFTSTSSMENGAPVIFNVTASDPEGDPLVYYYDFENDGTFDIVNAGNKTSHIYGDDFGGYAKVRVSDGFTSAEAVTWVTVLNVAPSISFTVTPSGNEAEAITFRARIIDPGSDDLRVTWSGSCRYALASIVYANDPAKFPDPLPSPEIHPRNITDTRTVVCGDNGPFAWNLRVEDDDGGVAVISGSFSISNLPPSFTISPPQTVTVENGTRISLNATASDSGSDDLTFTWTWQDGPTVSHPYLNNGAYSDLPSSPNGTYPFTAFDNTSFTYKREGTYTVTLTVMDDDGASITYSTTVNVTKTPPPPPSVPPNLDVRLIMVAAVIAVATTAVLLAFWIMRRRKQAEEEQQPLQDTGRN